MRAMPSLAGGTRFAAAQAHDAIGRRHAGHIRPASVE
jgi:hypothetical protein